MQGIWIFFIGKVIYGLLCVHLKFKVGFVRSQNLGNTIIIIFSKSQQYSEELSCAAEYCRKKNKRVKKWEFILVALSHFSVGLITQIRTLFLVSDGGDGRLINSASFSFEFILSCYYFL